MLTEPEITAPIDLSTPDGRLNRAAVGWSRRPLHRCALRGHAGRKKRWDYWCVTTEHHLFSITYADLDYLGLVSVFFLDYATSRTFEKNAAIPFAIGFRQPDSVAGADIHFDALGLRVDILEEPTGTRLVAAARGLLADLFIEDPPGHETLGVVVPWSDERFQYTSKHNTRPARGSVRLGAADYPFGPDNQAYGCLDFGRGVWNYECVWNWASASGRQNDRTLGLQFGGQWTDGTGMTENALCLDGRLHKLSEDLLFGYDRADFTKPWLLRTRSSNRVDLAFTPFYERSSRIELGIARSEVHQLFGRFSGTVEVEPGQPIAVTDLIGWSEEHRARW